MTARQTKSKKVVEDGAAIEVVSGDVSLDEDAPDDNNDAVRRPQEKQKASEGKLAKIEIIARILASLGVAGAAIFGVIEYTSANEDTRKERSLEIVNDWQKNKLIDRFTRVQAFVEEKLETSSIPPPNLPPDALKHAFQNLGYHWTLDLQKDAESEIEIDLDRLTLYFAQMEICISSKLCDSEVLRAYFQTEVTSFWQYFSGYAQFRQEANYLAYGTPVDALVARFDTMSQE